MEISNEKQDASFDKCEPTTDVTPEVGTVVERDDGEYHRNFTSRQIHIISLGGQIGAGLFISSGKNLLNGGPGGLLLGFAVVCSCVWALHQTLGEMTISFPVSGSFIDFADRFVDPAFSFAAGFSMWLGWTAIIAAEAVFFITIVNYWAQDRIPQAALITIFLVVLGALFVLPNYAFAWFEYFAAILKFVAFIIFIITGLALILGAGPKGHKADGKVWTTDMAFLNGFKGFSESTLLAILAIGDNTFTGFMAGETKNPRYSVGHAAFLIPIRVTVIYLISMTFIGLLVSPTNSQLFGGSGVAASPFVIAVSQAGIQGLPDFLNAVIMVAVASIAAESFFVATRILRSMAHQRLIPRLLAHVDRQGRPVPALLATTAITVLMAYINLSAGGITVFNWLAQISSTGYFMVWVFVGITSFRFRAALKAQNDPLFRQPYAWNGLAYKVVMRTKLRDPKTADLQTGRRPLSPEELVELDEYQKLPRWRKFYSFIQLW
ncbi:amino acid permease [Niveomyces insectorum RCEF 264]|uniref:Amino acid permease n=1 Tax=Niveomyces insectorum RCEF 264 TaxID=1081102 RepID=A0A167Y5E2_9HYPO|nr:amino acid permease [Niveomyces insectorum RCEF 264]